MKTFMFLLFLISGTTYGDENAERLALLEEARQTASQGSEEDNQALALLEEARHTLNLGSDAEVIALADRINPQIIQQIVDLNISITPEQRSRLQQLGMENKTALITALIIGDYPEDLVQQAAEIVPELAQLSEENKQAIFAEARKTVSLALFESMVRAEVQLGYLLGDVSEGVVAQINARLLNFRSLTFGDITIENLHAEVQVGYPQNGLLLLSGRVNIANSDFSFQGELLGLTYDIRKEALDFNILDARVNYQSVPWLLAYAGVGLSVRSYVNGVLFSVDPTVGLEAQADAGPVHLRGFVEGQYRSGEESVVVSCGGSAGLEILNTESIDMHAAIITELNVQTNPRPLDNNIEWLNSIGVSGEF